SLRREGGRVLALALLVLAAAGCYSGRFKRYDQEFADLGARADSLAAAHAHTVADLEATRKMVADHEQTMRSLRAGTETSAQDLGGRLDQIESRLEDQGHQIDDLAGRAHPRASVQPQAEATTPGAPADTSHAAQAARPKAPPAPVPAPSGAGRPQ